MRSTLVRTAIAAFLLAGAYAPAQAGSLQVERLGRGVAWLDTGTCEHCFHIGQAALNLASLVRQDGLIIQAMPLNSYNHGFYNVNPTWFFDFYADNGFEILYFQGASNVVTNPTLFEPPPFDRFRSAPDNSILVMVAKRTRMSELKVPMQRKYLVTPKLGSD